MDSQLTRKLSVMPLTDNLMQLGYDDRTLAELEEFMTPEVMEWASWQIDEFYPEYYKGVNEKYKELFSASLPFNPRYSPLSRRFSGSMGEDPIFTNGTPNASVVKGSLMSRLQGANAEVLIKDGDEILQRHVSEQEHFKAWGLPVRKLRSIFNDSEVKAAIQQNSKSDKNTTNQVIARFINDFASLGEDAKHANALVDTLRKNFTRYAIGLNPVVFMKQLTSAPAFASNMPAGQWLKYSARFWKAPIKNAKELMSLSSLLKARYRRGFDRDVVLMQKRGAAAYLSGATTFDDVVGLPTRVGDAMAIIGGGWPLYKYNLEKYQKEGMNFQKAQEKAIADFEHSTERLQQAGNVKDLSDYQRGGSFQKLFTMFITSPMSYYRLGANSLAALQGRKDLTKKEKADLSKNAFIAFVVLPMMFKFVADGFEPPDDAEEALETIVRSPINGIPFIREINTGIDIAQGKGWNAEVTPVGGFINEFASASRKLYRGYEAGTMTPDEIWAVADSLADGIGQVAGLPVLSAKRSLKAMTVDSDTPIRSAIGWSDTALGKHKISKKYSNVVNRIKNVRSHYKDFLETDPEKAEAYKNKKLLDLKMYRKSLRYNRKIRRRKLRIKRLEKRLDIKAERLLAEEGIKLAKEEIKSIQEDFLVEYELEKMK